MIAPRSAESRPWEREDADPGSDAGPAITKRQRRKEASQMSADARLVDAHLDATVSLRRAPGVILAAIAALAIVAVCAPSAVALPADRAFEKVSPDDKDGQDILNGLDKAAARRQRRHLHQLRRLRRQRGRRAGHRRSAPTARRPAGAPSRSHPPQVTVHGLASSLLVDFSDDVRTSVLGYAPAIRPSTAPPRAPANLYRRDPDGSKHTLTFGQPPPPGGLPADPHVRRGSADLSIGDLQLQHRSAVCP